MIESQVNYILQGDSNGQSVQNQIDRSERQRRDQFNEDVQKQLQGTVWQSGCVSWYQQDGGKNFSFMANLYLEVWLQTRKANPADYTFLG